MNESQLKALKVVDLKDKLIALNLPTVGKKDDLISRLLEAYKEKHEDGGNSTSLSTTHNDETVLDIKEEHKEQGTVKIKSSPNRDDKMMEASSPSKTDGKETSIKPSSPTKDEKLSSPTKGKESIPSSPTKSLNPAEKNNSIITQIIREKKEEG
jgi:hypothetical protein